MAILIKKLFFLRLCSSGSWHEVLDENSFYFWKEIEILLYLLNNEKII